MGDLTMDNIDDLQRQIDKVFVGSFGDTPLDERIADISREAEEVRRAGTLKAMKAEVGQLMCSSIQFCNEVGVDAKQLILSTLAEIEARQEQYKKLGRKLRVALFGGAFDPITVGHIAAARHVIESAKFDEVWLVPCFSHLYGKRMAAPEHRMKMVELACEKLGAIKPCDYEIKNELAGETYYFVKKIMAEEFANRRYSFSYVIGMDNANSFEKWFNFSYLERAISFIVVPRAGVEPEPGIDWYQKKPHIITAPRPTAREISSTKVRDMLFKKNPEVAEFLDPKVLEYIKANNLYQ